MDGNDSAMEVSTSERLTGMNSQDEVCFVSRFSLLNNR